MAAPACVPVPQRDGMHSFLYGIVVDAHGRPRAGVTVDAMRIAVDAFRGAEVSRVSTTTGPDGSYRLDAPLDELLVRFTDGAQRVVWMHFHALPGVRLDVRFGDEPIVVHEMEAGHWQEVDVPDCEWSCDDKKYPPGLAWWTDESCPPGTQLAYRIDDDVQVIECRLPDGTPHGPSTTSRWADQTDGWREESGWYDHGKKRGAWAPQLQVDSSQGSPAAP